MPRDIIKESPNPKAKIFFILYFPLYISFFHLQLLYKLYILIIRYEYKFPCIYRIIISPSLSYGYNERQGPTQPLVEKRLGTDYRLNRTHNKNRTCAKPCPACVCTALYGF